MSAEVNVFSIVPIEMLADRRLTLWHLRVLIALLSFRSKNTDCVWPSRETLAERCGGMHLTNVSKVTSELCELGWLTKEGTGGKSRATRYRITVPDLETVAESATVADSATQPTQTVAESTTQTVADSATGKEETSELTTKSNIPPSVASKPRPPEKITFDADEKKFNIPMARYPEWEQVFPKLDLDAEIDKAELWLSANPKRRKKNYERFLLGWFARAVENAKPRVFVKQAPPARPG